MTSLIRTRISFVYLVLIAATVISWEIGHGMGFHDIRLAGAAIIVVAFIKVRFVMLDFMEVRHAPLLLRIAVTAWLIVVCTTLVALYWGA